MYLLHFQNVMSFFSKYPNVKEAVTVCLYLYSVMLIND